MKRENKIKSTVNNLDMYIMRNPCSLTSSPNPSSSSRLFPILLDPKSF